VRAGQILAGTGLHLLVAAPAMALAFVPLFCGLAESSSRNCDGYMAIGLAGIGAYLFGAPAMAALGAKWAAAGDAQIGAGTYWWAVLVNMGALGGGIAIVVAVKGVTGLVIGLVAGALGASTIAALTLEYPPPDAGGQAALPRLAELARPVSSPIAAAPAARLGATAPLLAFRW
jgi:hypothetical protein